MGVIPEENSFIHCPSLELFELLMKYGEDNLIKSRNEIFR